MADSTVTLSRRQVLAGLGAMGAAGAGAGTGTSALLSDTESFEGSTLTAGTLDLKVDWEEHYSYPQLYGLGDPTVDDGGNALDVTRSKPSDTSAYVGVPDPDDPVVWVHEDDLGTYMANTAIEAFPDPDDDGTRDTDTGGFTYDPCTDGADLPEDLGTFAPNDDTVAARTKNGDTFGGGSREPLINLTDVKPGDFGELTFSFHLCDNPGYVWLQAANVSESGGANPQPEQAAEGDADNDADLAEHIETVWWYDDGDNVVGDGEEVFRRSTLKADLAELEAGVPLDGDRSSGSGFDEFSGSGDNENREPFPVGQTSYVGFGWWVPADVGNVIQGDSVSFDLGFYAEQARNNDGSLDT